MIFRYTIDMIPVRYLTYCVTIPHSLPTFSSRHHPPLDFILYHSTMVQYNNYQVQYLPHTTHHTIKLTNNNNDKLSSTIPVIHTQNYSPQCNHLSWMYSSCQGLYKTKSCFSKISLRCLKWSQCILLEMPPCCNGWSCWPKIGNKVLLPL